MDVATSLFLVQDAILNGAIYSLVGVSLVLIFAVTRVIFIAQGEFVAFSTLTFAALEAGKVPKAGGLLILLGMMAYIASLIRERSSLTKTRVFVLVLADVFVPILIVCLAAFLAPLQLGFVVEALLTFLLIVPMGPYIYRVVFEPLAEASVLVLLIASFGVHLALTGLGLGFFGPEGANTSSLVTRSFTVGELTITGQSLVVVGTTVALFIAFAGVFGRTLFGKALRACASNRLGARLVGIPTGVAGQITFGLAALLGCVCGILIGPILTVYYDSGFMIGLKGFVAAIIGALGSYVVTAAAALVVALVEAFSSFYVSAYKEIVVFTLLVPVLLWRSLRSPHMVGRS
ncbi:branched-chain amino acid ABC transporter permease [Bradyrhizobium tropiciagri]|uniref:branched-chain amino acid ABC transporter permease n=1 Tax=Bradyrhizobium tropiciagri TaxID=312253 RepID=UPI001BAC7EE0|nr:branched-chain amino acid ABC transporter permease [Bradyrhizobium tropiciagri]MBR0896722.1 branched-chain amino acid ABC transporter permease [Bradyrhizobium tropiciagri]